MVSDESDENWYGNEKSTKFCRIQSQDLSEAIGVNAMVESKNNNEILGAELLQWNSEKVSKQTQNC